jgi:hypothetical protein
MVNERLKPSFEKVLLKTIMVKPEITPKVLQTDTIKPDKGIQESYIKLMREMGYREPLKVAHLDDKYILLTDYEAYAAYQDIYCREPDIEIECIIVPCTSDLEIKKLSVFLSHFQAARDSHLTRLLNLDLLVRCSLSTMEIRELMNATAAADKRQLQRDLRLIRSPQMLGRVLGINNYERERTEPLLGAILQVKIFKADMTAKQAELYLTKMRDDPEIIKVFLTAYDEEKDHLRKFSMTAEEETKPFYNWRSFNFPQMLKLAESIAISGGYPENYSDDKADQTWAVCSYDELGDYHVPEIQFNLYDRSPKNIKKMISVAYRAELLANSLKGHIKRIRPIKHGAPIKVEKIEAPSNTPNFEHRDYLDVIREYKAILYCERDLIFKILKLRPSNFGFDSYRFDCVGSYVEAFSEYQKWWDKTFLIEVVRKYFRNPERHPHFPVYRLINDFLILHQNTDGPIIFADFFNSLFAHVMKELDNAHKLQEMNSKTLNDLHLKVKSHNWQDINDGLHKCGKVKLSKDELESIIKERVQYSEETIAKGIRILTSNIEKLTSDPAEITRRQRENLPLTLRDIVRD